MFFNKPAAAEVAQNHLAFGEQKLPRVSAHLNGFLRDICVKINIHELKVNLQPLSG